MRPIRIFISSVQLEFANERKMLYDYIRTDALLGKFFSVFLFENFPSANQRASSLYLHEVQTCDIYLGIFGKSYGYEDKDGISPTEHEFDCANEHSKTKLIFITHHTEAERSAKENALIKKAEQHVIRKQFTDKYTLKTAVYNALISYLEDKEYIRTLPFDASACVDATYDDLDEEKIRLFAGIAQRKRAFPISADAPIELILTHLNLVRHKHLTNAAILLFGKQPQRFFLSSEIKCAHFHGTTIAKPIPSYQVFKGDLFQLILQATDFVLSKINVSVGVRNKGVEAAIDYEIPIAAVSEAIINAVG